METNGTKHTGRLFAKGNKHAVGHGAPANNVNALKHGRRSQRRKLSLGQLPKGCSWIATRVSTLRRELELLTAATHGELDFRQELIIQSSCRHEQSGLLAQRWLRLMADDMSHSERLSYLQMIANESDRRDRAISLLKLERDTKDIFESLYASVPTVMDESELDATEETTGEDDAG